MIIDAQSKFASSQKLDFTPVVQQEELEPLPPPVQRYMEYTGVVGTPRIDTVRLRYRGKFRTAINNPWMPIRAEQVYTTNPPGFLWKARF